METSQITAEGGKLSNKEHIFIDGIDKTDSIKKWKKDNNIIYVTYYSKDNTYPYSINRVQLETSALLVDTTLKRFEYFKRLAKISGEISRSESSDSYNSLENYYNKIEFLYKGNMLTAFLTGKLIKPKQSYPTIAIFPFGFNMSQKTAIDNALENPLTIIEGPPGTGKTQTILNIIANAIMRDESVAVVSNNNSATKNVLEKLEKYHVGFIAAYLGNKDNKEKFIELQKQKPLPDITTWKLSVERKDSITQSLKNLYIKLGAMLEKKNKLAWILQELDAIKIEYEHFLKLCVFEYELFLRCLKPVTSSDAALDLWLICEKYAERGKMPGFFGRIINRFSHGVIKKAFYSAGSDMMIAICQKRWYMVRIAELTSSVSLLHKELDLFNFNEKMKEYSMLSLQLFQDHLTKKYEGNIRTTFKFDDLRKKSEKFIKEYPVILSTTYSLRNSLSHNVMYDYVIIDESSQVNLATGALALSCAKKAVVVGDLKQLPNVVDPKTAKKTDAVFAEFNLPEIYHYKNHSLLLSLLELFPDAPRTLLREHYRCHPKIIEFCNQKFYDNNLIILTEPKSDRKPLIVYKTVPGNHARDHVNQRQIDVIKDEIIPQQNLSDKKTSIGIVTPYCNQTTALQKTFSETENNIQADTVDKFQGRENDVIILSTVDNKISDFADNANRLNVAVSRAIKQLIVVVNGGDDMRGTNIGDLVRYIEYNNLEIVQSEICSVFDYLYSSYRKKRNELLRKQNKISEYDSENLMYSVIRNLLSNEQFTRFNVVVHVPLKRIIRDMKRLDAEETQYAQNISTHVDFLIFDKIGKIPRLIIEVDGMSFHAKGTKQAERDKLKNRILDKYELPYLRFRTNESREHERLAAALSELNKIKLEA
jgi:very-short-patch-repair endonuclease